ncbi:MAG: D-Ala-D-Ala carboxypeptidase family metallohydrolase [Pyrinomonadaceae bacterium MAG19_C2-C3]|nr:D-Ala-D-Ala carboxypeptidase family metallohydrolase [Pyrinomonadaceae bacterium MAG19_C2-C3]
MTLDLQQLSPHFTLWDFVTSQTAERNGINNTPSAQVIANLTKLCGEVLEPARCALGALKISSGYRSRALNRAVGGSLTSHHVSGWAADVQPYDVSKLEFAKWVKTHCRTDQIILEFGQVLVSGVIEPAWVHVSCHPRLRGQVLEINSRTGGKYVPVKL